MGETLPKDSTGKTTDKNTAEHASYGRTKEGFLARRTIKGSPEQSIVHDFNVFVDATPSADLNVDGSVTPVIFESGPPAGEIWYVDNFLWAFEDMGTLDFEDFGGITNGLTNGVLIEQIINGNSHEYINARSNLSIAAIGSLGQLVLGKNAGFLNSGGALVATAKIQPEVSLVGDNGDKYRLTIRDDITAINFFVCLFGFWKVVE